TSLFPSPSQGSSNLEFWELESPAFVFPHLPPKPVNIFFAFCISLSCVSAGILIYWYRQGDLEPKFRNLIYYILFSIIMLCICANLYFHEVGK
uniref:Transmembrane protein 243 n=1 Tax=Laticauda laticaudata TaxID=8630 RepID=A0A8C5RWN3_LATLA